MPSKPTIKHEIDSVVTFSHIFFFSFLLNRKLFIVVFLLAYSFSESCGSSEKRKKTKKKKGNKR